MGFGEARPILFALILAVFAPSAASAADAEVTDIRVGKHGLSTRIVVDLDRPVKAEVFTLAGPARLVIDLPEVGWRLPAQWSDSTWRASADDSAAFLPSAPPAYACGGACGTPRCCCCCA